MHFMFNLRHTLFGVYPFSIAWSKLKESVKITNRCSWWSRMMRARWIACSSALNTDACLGNDAVRTVSPQTAADPTPSTDLEPAVNNLMMFVYFS